MSALMWFVVGADVVFLAFYGTMAASSRARNAFCDFLDRIDKRDE